MYGLTSFNLFESASNSWELYFVILPLLLGYSFGTSFLPVIIIAAIQSLLVATILSVVFNGIRMLFIGKQA